MNPTFKPSEVAPIWKGRWRRWVWLVCAVYVILIGLIVYWAAWFFFGPWELIPKVTARATSSDGSLRAKIYRKGFQFDWEAHCRVESKYGVVFERMIDVFSTMEEPEHYFSEIRFDGNFLLVGPHASHKHDVIDYYRIPLYEKWEVVQPREGR